MTLDSFVADERTYDAVLRNLEVLGEAAKRVPDALRAEMPEVSGAPARDSGFRDLVAHLYFALVDAIALGAAQHEVPKAACDGFAIPHGYSGAVICIRL